MQVWWQPNERERVWKVNPWESHQLYFVLFQDWQATKPWSCSPSQVSHWPVFRGEEVAANGSDQRSQAGEGIGVKEEWPGTECCSLSSLRATRWACEAVWHPSSRQIRKGYRPYFKSSMRKQMLVSSWRFELFCVLSREMLKPSPTGFLCGLYPWVMFSDKLGDKSRKSKRETIKGNWLERGARWRTACRMG